MLEPNYDTTKWFSENLLTIKLNKTKVKLNKPIYLGMSALSISKAVMHEFLYYIKPKYHDKANLCCVDTDSFLVSTKSEDVHKDITSDAEKRFDT